MKKLVSNITVSHNERWPREGIMFVETLLLYESDILHFEWCPKEPTREIFIEIETRDYKGAL